MTYVKTQGGQTIYPYSIGQLRKENPSTSFPKSIPNSTLEAYGVHLVTFVDTPAYNADTQRIEQDTQPTEVNGQWELGWAVVNLTVEELATKTKTAGDEARALRGRLLAASDWTQVADAPVDQAAWSTYRQALRDLPDQAGFPDNVTWPEKP